MNAALLLMTSTFMAGADAPAAHPAATATAAVAGCGSGCGTVGCDTACDPCASKPSILEKFKARMGCHKRKNSCCETACAPTPTCAPAPKTTCCAAPAPTCNACDSCGSARPNLLDKIKAKLQSRKHKSDCCAPSCDGCGAAAAPVPVTPPKDMPKPMDPKKDPKKAGSDGAAAPIVIPTPGAVLVPTIPVTPVSGPKLTGANSPY